MTNRDYFGFKGMIQRRQHAQPFPLTRPIAPFPDSHPHPERDPTDSSTNPVGTSPFGARW
ncbi:hypothetical protein BHE90_016157 [Fusarium euwallaceae]|uniref:Uncharacterized protein n=2 Tax=Fusarium solani species complex TaxID=232080 RepID=A0A430L152_9HYPO|nr:hypothetical protein CDV31_015775 [Fusarium ambrosium]RTE69463.1 hypothetical protein BHE90_016157 [Fusarium euwallaceae]